MRISEHTLYYSKKEAEEDIRLFKELHPKSKKKYKSYKPNMWWIVEESK